MDTLSNETIKEILNFNTETNEKCPHCGKPYKRFESQLAIGKFVSVHVADCGCMQKKKEEQERKEQEEKLQKIFESSLMTPLFGKKTFENIAMTASEYGSVKELEICKKYAQEFDKKKSAGIYMVGKPGTGKTTLLACICNFLMKKGYKCLFLTMSALFDKFSKYSYDNSGDISALLSWLTKYDFIVIDDIGRGGESPKRQEIAYRIIDTLMNFEIPTCFSANPEMIKELRKIPAWGAIIDRIKDMCGLQIEFRGESLRGLKWR